MELWQDSCEEEVIQRCQAFLQQSLEINEVISAVAKKNYNSDYGQDNAMMMMMMMIMAVIKISS